MLFLLWASLCRTTNNEMCLHKESYSVSIKTLSSLTQIVACWSMIFFFSCHTHLSDGLLSFLPKIPHLFWFPREKTVQFSLNMHVCSCYLINHHLNITKQLWFPKPHLTSSINCTGLIKFRHGKYKSGSFNDEFAVCHNISAHWDTSLCHHSYLPL